MRLTQEDYYYSRLQVNGTASTTEQCIYDETGKLNMRGTRKKIPLIEKDIRNKQQREYRLTAQLHYFQSLGFDRK